MSTPKKKLFIGSSFKELPLADKVRSYLENDFDITVWHNDWNIPGAPAFVINKSFLHDLLKASLQYDFGLMLGTSDDQVVKDGKVVMQPRDNVLFEFGLFLGRMGTSRCALLVEKGIHVPTDLEGVTQAQFEKGDTPSLLREVRKIRDTFLGASSSEVNFFPSATLAATYYGSLIVPICSTIISDQGFTVQGKHYSKCILKIIIPPAIEDDVNLQFDKLKSSYKLTNVSFKYKGRPRNISIDTRPKGDVLEFIDFPTIIAGINFAISNLLPDDFNHNNVDYKAILERELDRFVITLDKLITRNYKGMVEIQHQI